MLRLIQELVDDGHAYVVEGQGVYFDVAAYPEYGELSGRTLDDLLGVGRRAGRRRRAQAQSRRLRPVEGGEAGRARVGLAVGPRPPGWHIECSAMSLDLLGEGFDLHGGGDDLVFPHHENERAQAEAAGHPFARYWIHNGMVMVGGEKMAKSIGNFTTLRDALDRHGGRAFRMAVLQTQYRRQIELGDGELAAGGRGRRPSRRTAPARPDCPGAHVRAARRRRGRDVP